MFDLTQEHGRKAFCNKLLYEIDAYALRTYNDGPRKHLGASITGQECLRAAWYSFRWFASPPHDGRIQRLFRRGHLEELRFIEYLKGIGAKVYYEEPGTGKQYKCEAVGGHMGGSIDAIVEFPPGFHGITERIVFLGEFKTKGTGSGFVKLKENGIRVTNPTHYGQMCLYGSAYQFRYALYFAVNKNDDDMHIEIVQLDWNYAQQLVEKGKFVVGSRVPPNKCSLSPVYKTCKMCDFVGVCHEARVPPRNCRTCIASVPAASNGAWHCERHNCAIDEPMQRTSCNDWKPMQ